MVPSLDEDDGYSNIAEKIRNQDPDAWQRMLSEKRQRNIGSFWRNPKKHIANSVMMSFDTDVGQLPDEVLIPTDSERGQGTLCPHWMDVSKICKNMVDEQLKIRIHCEMNEY